MSQFTCPKCGAPLDVNSGTHIAACQNCGTPVYIDRKDAIFFYQIHFSVDETQARGIFKRWTAGPDREKDLEISAKIEKCERKYFPVFSFTRNINGNDAVIVHPAHGTLLPGMHRLKIPPGDLLPYTGGKLDAPVLEPDIPIDTYIGSLEGNALSQSLIYFPIYEVEYTYKGQKYQLVIDGSSGDVFTGPCPSRSSMSFAGVMALSTIMGFVGGILGLFVNPVFFFISVGGLFTGKILGYFVSKQKKAVTA